MKRRGRDRERWEKGREMSTKKGKDGNIEVHKEGKNEGKRKTEGRTEKEGGKVKEKNK